MEGIQAVNVSPVPARQDVNLSSDLAGHGILLEIAGTGGLQREAEYEAAAQLMVLGKAFKQARAIKPGSDLMATVSTPQVKLSFKRMHQGQMLAAVHRHHLGGNVKGSVSPADMNNPSPHPSTIYVNPQEHSA